MASSNLLRSVSVSAWSKKASNSPTGSGLETGLGVLVSPAETTGVPAATREGLATTSAEVGAGTNIGAGSITANFDHRPGVPKKRTVIGRNGRVAVDTMFVAPVTVGDDVWTAAGSVVTDDVPDNALVGFAPRQTIKEGRGGKRDS